MTFIRIGRMTSGLAIRVVLAAGVAAAAPIADGLAQSDPVRAVEGISAATTTPVPTAEIAAGTSVNGSRSKPAEDTERDRRLVLLRLLVFGGGAYRPFGFFR